MLHSMATTRHSSRPRSDSALVILEASETLVVELKSKLCASQSIVSDALHACTSIREMQRSLETR